MSRQPWFRRYDHPALETAWKIAKAQLGISRTPLFVNFLLTYECNLRCGYCGVWKNPPPTLSTETICRLIDEIADSGAERLSFSGGEPMLRGDIGHIIDYAKDRGLTVNLVSNGFSIPERIKELSRLDFLSISLDGPKELHDGIRGRNAFAQAIKAIQAARKAGVEVWTTSVLTNRNVSQIAEILDICEREGARATFLPVMAEGLRSRDTEALSPSRQAFREAMAFLLKMRAEKSGLLPSSPALFKLYRDRWQAMPSQFPGPAHHGGTLPCQAGKLFCSISPDGTVYPCNFLQGASEGRNALASGFEAAWRQLPEASCKGCWCDSFIEANLIFSWHPGAILNAIKILR